MGISYLIPDVVVIVKENGNMYVSDLMIKGGKSGLRYILVSDD